MAKGYLPTIDLRQSPTLERFFTCDDYFTGVEGPPGSGKTIASIAKLGKYALQQQPDALGWRRTRWAVIRNTYPDLRSTTIQSWCDIFKPEFCGPIIYGSPISHHIKVPPFKKPGDPDFRPGIDMLVWFLALDKPADARKLKSLQITGAWINEATEIMPEILEVLTTRCGRYPSVGTFDDSDEEAVGVGATWEGIIADTNAGDDDNWWHRFKNGDVDEELKAKHSWQFFLQPPAVLEVQRTGEGFVVSEPGFEPMTFRQHAVVQAAGRYWVVNPEAENLANLKPGYYERQIPNKTLPFIQRFLQVKTIYVADGKPWVPEYSDEMMSDSLPYDNRLPLFGGIDIGSGTLQPAAVIGQRGAFGDVRILAELAMFDIGLDRFSTELAAFVQQRFGVNHSEVEFCIDPAGEARDGLFETSWTQHLRHRKFKVRPAFTNDQDTRRDALALPMGRLINTGSGKVRPGFLIDRQCAMLRAALAGKWCVRRIQVAGTERYQNKPEKNRWSNVGDAAGYFCMGVGEGKMLIRGGDVRTGAKDTRRPVVAMSEFNVLGGS